MELRKYVAKEVKLVTLRECLLTEETRVCDTPEKAAAYWRAHIADCPYLDSERECFVIVLLNTRRHVKGHHFVSMGTLDTILVHPREVFRVAIVAAAAAIILMHNHPSGDPTPSEADVKATRDLIRAGQLIKIEVLDHVVLGRANGERSKDWVSLRELGYFY